MYPAALYGGTFPFGNAIFPLEIAPDGAGLSKAEKAAIRIPAEAQEVITGMLLGDVASSEGKKSTMRGFLLSKRIRNLF